MTKEEALAAIKLLSALESWAFSNKALLPDYLHDDLCVSMKVLDRIVLEKPCGMDGLEGMSKMSKRPLKDFS